jgi:1,4-alpha-glucan branching enzyme
MKKFILAVVLTAFVLPMPQQMQAAKKDFVSEERKYEQIEKNPKRLNADFWNNSPILMRDNIVFFFQGKANRVLVAGDFNDWKPDLLMQKQSSNVWKAVWDTRLSKGKHTYKLLVDDIWISDPNNTNTEMDESGQTVSYFELKEDFIPFPRSPLWLKGDTYRFRYESPKAKSVYLVGDFNNWNPYNIMMTNNGSDEFFITVRLKPGLRSYCFVVDGEWRPDPDNLNQYSDEVGNIVSIVNIREQKR